MPHQPDAVECPACKGVGHVFGLTSRGKAKLPCSFCAKTGKTTAERLAWFTAGKEMRAKRVARDVSLRDFCERLKVDPRAVADMEAGRAKPDESLYAKI